MQEKFKEFILNDIFWFNKSELNFGIYKIFRQKETFIKEKLDEIVNDIEIQLSSSNEKDLQVLIKDLKDNFIPPKFQMDTLEEIENGIKKYCNGNTDEYLQQLASLKTAENYDTTKVYEYLYQFFNLYYEKGDFGYTPRSFRTYSIPYKYEEYLNDTQNKSACENSSDVAYGGEETLFTWKTKDSYYIKSNKFLNSVTLNLDYKNTNYTININIVEKDEDIKDDKKVKQYRLISIKKEDNKITLNFNISDFATPKHTIYLAMLSVVEEDIKELDYNAIFKDKKLKEYFENLPLKDTAIQTSLLDDTQSKFQKQFVKLMSDETIINYIIDTKKDKEGNIKSATNIFKYALSGEEDKTQLKSKTSKLMVSKKEYASKLYSNTTAKAFLGVAKKEKFDIEDKKDYEKLYENDAILSFFYRLDRGVNLFYAGVDSDYFIHKNLKRFLSVELDKFIKNYIFADTDAILLMDENAKKIATFARVFKTQANIFIDLLSSIEEFQKYLWEKRKMVKSSHYVISSNKLEDINLLEIILKNRDQTDEWEALDIIKPNKKPNILELQSHSYPVDTKHFDMEFKYKILSQFENIDDELSGLLIKSENYQALRFLEPKYTDKKGDGKIKCVYIDPPYNTGNDGFVYKDSFKSASWLSMMSDRLEVARGLMREDGVIFSSIDENEVNNLNLLKNEIYGKENFISNITILANKGGQDYLKLSKVHENLIVYGKSKSAVLNDLPKENLKLNFEDIHGKYQLRELRNRNPKFHKGNRPNLYFPIYVNPDKSDKYGFCDISLAKDSNYSIEVYPLNSKGMSSVWRWGKDKIENEKFNLSAKQKKDGNWNINEKYRKITEKAKSVWDESEVSTESGTKAVRHLFGEDIFSHPKPPKLIEKVGLLSLNNQTMLDYFAGSGTSFNSLININALKYLDDSLNLVITQFKTQKDKKNMSTGLVNVIEEVNAILDNFNNLSFEYSSTLVIIDLINKVIIEEESGKRTVNIAENIEKTIDEFLDALIDLQNEFTLNSKNDYIKNKYIGIEFGDYFNKTTLSRIKKNTYSLNWIEGKPIGKYGYSSFFQYIELEQYDDIIDNLEVIDKDIAYHKAPLDYIYQPDKNQIAFRMDNELKNPLDDNGKFDIFSSLIFHEGLELININLDDDVLRAKVKDRYSKECYVVLGSDKKKVGDKIDTIKNDNIKIYTNHTVLHTEQIMAETFKGK